MEFQRSLHKIIQGIDSKSIYASYLHTYEFLEHAIKGINNILPENPQEISERILPLKRTFTNMDSEQ